jgi:HEAT repeat protein
VPRLVFAVFFAFTLTLRPVGAGAQGAAPDLQTNIARLSALAYPTRMNAARTIRRLPAAEAVPALVQAVQKHQDEFVRYRAFILLSSFNDRGTGELVRGLLRDANDRLREAAYKWLEAHPDPAMVPTLLGALQTEEAEFVRPAAVSAIAAHGDDMRVQRALLGEIGRGLDFFRAAVIDALGRRRASYALDAITAVAKLQGPLQDDAVIALGRIGGARALAVLKPLAVEPPSPALTLTLQAAQCLAGEGCGPGIKSIADGVSTPSTSAAMIRAGLSGLTAIAAGGNQAAMDTLVTIAERGGVLRDQSAIGLGTVAVMNAEFMLRWLDRTPQASRDAVITLLKDGFDDLEEDFGEEQFFAATRAAYWAAPEGSAARSLSSLLIQRLEF